MINQRDSHKKSQTAPIHHSKIDIQVKLLLIYKVFWKKRDSQIGNWERTPWYFRLDIFFLLLSPLTEEEKPSSLLHPCIPKCHSHELPRCATSPTLCLGVSQLKSMSVDLPLRALIASRVNFGLVQSKAPWMPKKAPSATCCSQVTSQFSI